MLREADSGRACNLLPNSVQSMTRNKMRGVQQGVLVRAEKFKANVQTTKLLWACNTAQNRLGPATLSCRYSVCELTALLLLDLPLRTVC
jgi:hypothetical protein